MAFCKKCGSPIPNDSAFCPACGTRVDDAQQADAQQNYNQGYQQNNYQQNNYQPNGYQQNTYQPNGFQQNNYQPNGYQQPIQPGVVTGSERGLAWLSYMLIAPAFLVPLFVKKRSEYCRFHVKQGATLWAISTAYWIFELIFLAIINAIFPGRLYYAVYNYSAIYNVFSVILSLGFVALSVFAVIGIVFAATGKQKELPLISKIPWVGMLIDKIYNAINN